MVPSRAVHSTGSTGPGVRIHLRQDILLTAKQSRSLARMQWGGGGGGDPGTQKPKGNVFNLNVSKKDFSVSVRLSQSN